MALFLAAKGLSQCECGCQGPVAELCVQQHAVHGAVCVGPAPKALEVDVGCTYSYCYSSMEGLVMHALALPCQYQAGTANGSKCIMHHKYCNVSRRQRCYGRPLTVGASHLDHACSQKLSRLRRHGSTSVLPPEKADRQEKTQVSSFRMQFCTAASDIS